MKEENSYTGKYLKIHLDREEKRKENKKVKMEIEIKIKLENKKIMI